VVNYLVARGDAYLAHDEFDRAVADADRALALAPDDRRAQGLKHNALAAKSAVATNPNPAAPQPTPGAPPPAGSPSPNPQLAQMGTALQLVGQHRIDDAIKELDRAVAADPTAIAPLQLRATLHSQKREFAQAIEDFNSVLRIAPRSAVAHRLRGVMFAST